MTERERAKVQRLLRSEFPCVSDRDRDLGPADHLAALHERFDALEELLVRTLRELRGQAARRS